MKAVSAATGEEGQGLPGCPRKSLLATGSEECQTLMRLRQEQLGISGAPGAAPPWEHQAKCADH